MGREWKKFFYQTMTNILILEGESKYLTLG